MKEWSTLKKLIWLWGAGGTGGGDPLSTFTGAIIRFLASKAKPIKSIVANFSPQQSLNGQDAPWPPGGGKNLLPNPSAVDATENGVRFQSDGKGNYHISGEPTAVATYAFNIPQTTLPSADIYIHLLNPVANSNINVFFYNDATQVAGITLGQINRIYKLTNLSGATINSVRVVIALALVGEQVDVSFSPMLCLDNVAKPFAPYSNICPIEGHTAVDVTRDGKNMFPLMLTPKATSGVTVTNVDGGYKLTSTASSGYLWARFLLLDASKFAGKTLTVSGTSAASDTGNPQLSLFYRNENDEVVTRSDGASSATLAIPANAKGNISVALYLTTSVSASSGWTTTWTKLQLEIGESASAYEPYSGTTVSISFGTTVYGGELTVNEDGTGTVKAKPHYASYNGETLVGPWMSSMDAYTSGATPTTGAEVVDMGGTETTIPLTPGQIQTLVGENVVFVNDATGDITVQAYGTEIT